jgi:hypothetical protein
MLTMESSLLVFLAVYFANLLLDYPLQSSFEAKWKAKSNYVLFVHSTIWGLGVTFTIIWLTGEIALWKIPMLIVGHALMDGFKARRLYLGKDARKMNIDVIQYGTKDYIFYMVDQTFHVAQLCAALYF